MPLLPAFYLGERSGACLEIVADFAYLIGNAHYSEKDNYGSTKLFPKIDGFHRYHSLHRTHNRYVFPWDRPLFSSQKLSELHEKVEYQK